MAVKQVDIAGIGPVLLMKRKGSRYMRLSVTASGKVRVTTPSWTPHYSAISFAKSRSEWINDQLKNHKSSSLVHGSKVGKTRTLRFIYSSSSRLTSRLSDSHVSVHTNMPFSDPHVQCIAKKAAEKALKLEAAELLPVRLRALALQHQLHYSDVQIKKFSSRWGSCSSDKVISLNYFLMQLPWKYIDAVLLHELIHTLHMDHGPKFWEHFNSILPNARQIQKEIKQFKPVIQAIPTSSQT